MTLLSRLADKMDQAVSDGVFPGAVLRVQRGQELVHESCHGFVSEEADAVPVDSKTVFDLASLTKVLAVGPLMLCAMDRGELDLDSPVLDFLSIEELPGCQPVVLRHLLEHSSGLAAWRACYEELASSMLATTKGRDGIREMVLAERFQAPPDIQAEYSDLGFILLDWILETACGAPLDRLFESRVAKALGCEDVFFIDLKDSKRAKVARGGRSFAATERCPWRGRVLCGEVHDDNAYAMGGVSGHAGLFGTAAGVACIAQAWLAAYLGRPSLFIPEMVREFFSRSQVFESTRALAFDTPSPEGSQAGSLMGPATVGHTGFTGTSLWIDPDRELIAILLSNRVHPTRQNESIKSFRPGLHDALVEVFDEEYP